MIRRRTSTPRLATLVVRRPAQLEALASPGRMEVLDALQALGPSTVAALAAHLGRPRASLYYHVHRLTAVGLARRDAAGRARARAEAVYRLAAEKVVVESPARAPRVAGLLARAAGGVLRRAAREYAAALEHADLRARAPEPFHARMKGRLPPAAAAEVQRHVLAIQRIFARERAEAGAPLCALTAVFTPLAERGSARRRRR